MKTTLLAHRPTTAEILYHMADYLDLLQKFVSQHINVAPDSPRRHKFPNYCQDNTEGKLRSVAANALNHPCEIQRTKVEFRLHSTIRIRLPRAGSLFGRQGHLEAVQRRPHGQLAGQPRVRLDVKGEIEHVGLFLALFF